MKKKRKKPRNMAKKHFKEFLDLRYATIGRMMREHSGIVFDGKQFVKKTS